MKALVLKQNKILEYVDVPMPQQPAADWTLLRIANSGICNSDIQRGFAGGAYRYPLIMGHEFSATVAEPGAGSRFSSGDRVVITAGRPIWEKGTTNMLWVKKL